jgi:hypothetical protein
MKTMRARTLVLASLLLAAPATALAQDCSNLPATAQRARQCNPQQECMAKVEQRFKGPALEAARRDCARLPPAGTCYGPETYSPQAECRERQGGRRK